MSPQLCGRCSSETVTNQMVRRLVVLNLTALVAVFGTIGALVLRPRSIAATTIVQDPKAPPEKAEVGRRTPFDEDDAEPPGPIGSEIRARSIVGHEFAVADVMGRRLIAANGYAGGSGLWLSNAKGRRRTILLGGDDSSPFLVLYDRDGRNPLGLHLERGAEPKIVIRDYIEPPGMLTEEEAKFFGVPRLGSPEPEKAN